MGDTLRPDVVILDPLPTLSVPLGISTHLADYGVTEKALPGHMESARKQAMWLNMNFKPITEADAKNLFVKALA